MFKISVKNKTKFRHGFQWDYFFTYKLTLALHWMKQFYYVRVLVHVSVERNTL